MCIRDRAVDMAGKDVEGLYAALAKSGWLENALRLNGIYNVCPGEGTC